MKDIKCKNYRNFYRSNFQQCIKYDSRKFRYISGFSRYRILSSWNFDGDGLRSCRISMLLNFKPNFHAFDPWITRRCYEYYRCYRVPTLTILMTLNINISDFGCYQIFDAIELQRYSILTFDFDVDFWRYYVNLHSSTDSTRYLSSMLSNFNANKFQYYPPIHYWMLISFTFLDRKDYMLHLIFQNSYQISTLLITLNRTHHSWS